WLRQTRGRSRSFFFSSRRRHTRCLSDWSSDVCSSDLTGPMLRASGVAYDVRKDFPYLDYETYDFEVPVGTSGDVYDRYLVRMERSEERRVGKECRARRERDEKKNNGE